MNNEWLPPSVNLPAVSVIIPMYNAEKYLNECIDSILEQTFKDFELIIVDDCSTDSSCEIVESYMQKFNGRLKLYHTEKNTGSGVIARNIGLSHASGEYVYNMDNDDIITKTALEEMYNLSKKYDADVVYCERYYMSSGDDLIKNRYIATRKVQNPPYINEPTLISEDLFERVQEILDVKIWYAPWLKLVRRDLLEMHKIIFPVLKIGDDDIWTYALIFFAKRWLRVPNMIYIRRMRENSISEVQRTPQDTIHFWLNPILLGLKELDNIISQIDFFKENHQQRYAVLEQFFYGKLCNAFKNAKYLTKAEVYNSVKNEFGKNFGEYDVLVSALCTTVFEQQKNVSDNLCQIHQIQENKKMLAEKDAEINRLREALTFQTSLLPQASYAISVIIPMYNASRYISECLESLLIQTFQDFEIIIVDDCSTDNSVEIVESYRLKFNGRLKLTKTEQNSGGGGYVPRNIGFKLARGNYVYFMDADDFLLNSALEIFYTTAEKYMVDVVYVGAIYYQKKLNDVSVWRDSKTKELISRVIEGENYDKFLHELASEGVFTYPWLYFVRRDFLLQNNIVFPEIMKAGDYLWVVNICCQTKKIFRLTKPLYFYNHYNINSVSNVSADTKSFEFVLAFTDFVKALEDLACKIKFLSNNPLYVYSIINRYFKVVLKRIKQTNSFLLNQEIFEALYYDCISNRFSLMIPFFFNALNFKEKDLVDLQDNFRKFRPYIFARMDIKLLSIYGDFQIFSLSDNKANLSKPSWLQKGGVGYMIVSCKGDVKIVAKASTDGKIRLDLRSLDIHNSEDKTKRIPYWIDYTKLTVNGKVIFDSVKPTWHDKPYSYALDVKADEEIKIEVEWLPHRDERFNVSADAIKEQEKNAEMLRKSDALVSELRTALNSEKKAASKQNTLVSELRTALDNERSVHSEDVELIRKFSDYFTARLDFKLVLNGEGNFQIVSVSDEKAVVKKVTRWLSANEIGYYVQSYVGKMEIVGKVIGGGQFNLNLRGMDIRDPKNKRKRIPYWIDYTKLTVNGEVIFDKITPAWHDKPYNYALDVKVDEEIKIEVEWLPHIDDRSNLSIDATLVSELRAALDSEKKSASKQNALISELRTALDSEKKAASKQNALVAELRAALDNEKKSANEQNDAVPDSEREVPSNDVELIHKFGDDCCTARLDFKLMPNSEGDFQVVSVSDEKAIVKKSRWLSANEVGYYVQSCVGKMEIVGKVIGGGQFNLNLRGMDVRDPKNRRERIPYWIDYTRLTVNGEVILDKITPVWHDKPYNYIFYAKTDEEIKIEVEWVPHKSDT